MSFFAKQKLAQVFIRDRAVMASFILALALNGVSWALLAWRARSLGGETSVPLHYTIYFGVDWVGSWYKLLIPAFFGFVALLVNYTIVFIVYEDRRFFAYAYALGTVALEVIILASSFFIILLNF